LIVAGLNDDLLARAAGQSRPAPEKPMRIGGLNPRAGAMLRFSF